MDALVIKAIEEKLLLEFLYEGEVRLVEPHTYGRKASGVDYLCAWQISGGSGEGFRLFNLGNVFSVSLKGTRKFSTRPGYRREDKRFSIIYTEV